MVIGDAMLDHYVYGEASRISPEAPVPVVRRTGESYNLGGAGNVAANIASLGGKAHLIGLFGDDPDGAVLVSLLAEQGIAYSDCRRWSDRCTTSKTRIIANGQQVGRVDSEVQHPITGRVIETLQQRIRYCCADACAIVISDYGKGVITLEIMDTIRECASDMKLPIFLDPKVSQAEIYRRTHSYYPIEVITPNHPEAEGLAGPQESMLRTAAKISSQYAAENVLITRGEDGMSLFASVFNAPMRQVDIPTAAREVFDVSGAGDTVIAALALAFASGYTIEQSARLANIAAGVAVGKRGTATVSYDELASAGGNEICVDAAAPAGI
mgnify:CR=1 FL=1